MRQNIKEGIEEREITNALNKEYRQKPGFTEFPYTHGDAVNEVRQELLTKQKAEYQQKQSMFKHPFQTSIFEDELPFENLPEIQYDI